MTPPQAGRGAAGGDPYAAGIAENPYNIVPVVSADDGPPALVRATLAMQRQRLSRDQDQAFRTLRNLGARLGWDLLTLGTTPSVTPEEWAALRSQLDSGQRREAAHRWLEQEAQDGSLHVRAVLALNEAAWQAGDGGAADDDALGAFVAWWAALLFRKEWLRTFARWRCQVWKIPPPDSGDEVQFFDRAANSITAILVEAAGPDTSRVAKWARAMERERAAIEAVHRACGARAKPPAWTGGYGPVGLKLLQQEDAALGWIVEHARSTGELLPLSALKSNQAGFFQLSPDKVDTAARAIQMLFSELGEAASLIWQGQATKALAVLAEEKPASGPASPWFGRGGNGRRSRDEAVHILRVEALLLQLQEELARPEVPAEAVCETAARILSFSAMLAQPRVGVRQVESRLCGRLTWCADGDRLPDPREVERILDIGREMHGLLVGRGEGQQCALEMAKLLNHRAVLIWNRGQGQRRPPRMREQERLLRDLFEAARLAPHNHEFVSNLAGMAIQFPCASLAEQRSLLMKVLPIVKNCISIGKPSSQMEETYDRLLEVVDPEEARKVTLERLRKALEQSPGTRS
jgi:hypothetical protein